MGEGGEDRRHQGAIGMFRRLLIGATAGAIVALALVVAIEWAETSQRAESGRALLARNAQLTVQVLAPGSALACLDTDVGADVDAGCEMAVFESPQGVAAASAYVAARLALIRAAFVRAEGGQPDVFNELKAERRGLARDRFGFVAHVLARDYGCTPKACGALAMLNDGGTLKTDLEKRPLETYVTRHAVTWAKPPVEGTPVAAAPPATGSVIAAVGAVGASPQLAPGDNLARGGATQTSPVLTHPHPVDSRWKFPSADSIPAVSIMTPEPKLPKGEANPTASQAQQEAAPPLPPKRPQAEAAPRAEAR